MGGPAGASAAKAGAAAPSAATEPATTAAALESFIIENPFLFVDRGACGDPRAAFDLANDYRPLRKRGAGRTEAAGESERGFSGLHFF
ncbi:hypothetical protein GCM10017750_37830 [Streptomyces racemochromogenes]